MGLTENMPRPRAQLVSLEATAYYHCISRCVRRAFLLGKDPLTARNFDHRRQWIAERLTDLAGVFAIDICAYGLMSNHAHVVVHIDAERARTWEDEEVIARYERLFPATVAQMRLLAAPKQAAKVSLWRQRLFDLSWFMRCLNESIARRANGEDGCTGRFWEGRFRSQALLDIGALVACMAYVDLNPMRAGVAGTLEESDLTSIQARLLAGARPPGLAPFADEVPRQLQAGAAPIEIERDDYIDLLRWTAAAWREHEAQGAGPEPVLGAAQGSAPPRILQRLGLDGGGFLYILRNYPRSFFTMVGRVQKIDLEARRRGYRRRPGISGARRLYRDVAA